MTETFKQRMKRLRVRAGFKSQQMAADAIGCERGTVGMWEAASSNVESVGGYLLAVARAYRVRPEYVNTGKGDDGYPWSPGDETEPPAALPRPSQSVGSEVERIRTAAKFLEDLFAARDKVFVASAHVPLLLEVSEYLSTADSPNLVALAFKLGKRLDDDDERQRKVAGAG